MLTHHRHVLSADHPAPPCFEGKAKRVMASCLTKCDRSQGEALDDIKKGEKVVIE
jgi:hypothetical protein